MLSESQRAALRFLRLRAQDQDSFSAADVERVAGWASGSFATYKAKQLREYVESAGKGKYTIKPHFSRLTDDDFQNIVSQTRKTVARFVRAVFDAVLKYEFLLPLTNERKLRSALDELFYRDHLLQRAKEIGEATLATILLRNPGEASDAYIDRVVLKVSALLGGYSIGHVNGRFRVGEAIVNRGVFALLLRTGRIWPALIPKSNRLVRAAYFRPRRTVASSHQALTLAMPPSHQEIEYALPRELAAESLRRTRALVERDRLRVNFIAELRFVAGDDAWMSPDYRRESAHLGAYMASAPDLPRYFSAFEAEMLALGGRPHWGKQFSATAEDLRAAYPEYDRFDALRRKVDPQGVFGNAFLERVFPRSGEASLAREAAGAGV